MFAEPHHHSGARPLWVAAAVAAVLLLGVGAWLLLDETPDAPETTTTAPESSAPASVPPEGDNAAAAPAERPAPASSAARPASKAPRASDTAAAPAPAPPAAPSLRVESDVPGAMVFVNRKYLGTTPLVSREITPGSHQLNVQVEGRDPVVQTIDVAESGETRVAVELAAVRLDARVAVVHKHGVGACEGTLLASPAGLRYQTSHDKDGFTLGFAQIETFSVDYLEKRLRVKQRGGRTWNFTTKDDNADPLLVFHREVESR
jgi:hypothetical protein